MKCQTKNNFQAKNGDADERALIMSAVQYRRASLQICRQQFGQEGNRSYIIANNTDKMRGGRKAGSL